MLAGVWNKKGGEKKKKQEKGQGENKKRDRMRET